MIKSVTCSGKPVRYLAEDCREFVMITLLRPWPIDMIIVVTDETKPVKYRLEGQQILYTVKDVTDENKID